MDPLTDDVRFREALAQLNRGEFFEASEGFEDLFFEAVRDEVAFVRVFLQVSVGLFHLDCRQWRPGVERLGEAILAIYDVTNDRGFDLQALRVDIEEMIRATRSREPVKVLRIRLMEI